MIYLGLGSNMGDRHAYLQKAVRRLTEISTLWGISNVYESAPWGPVAQDRYLNLVLAITTPLEPLPFLAATQAIEEDLGRTHTVRYGPRTIDIDLLLWGKQQLEEPTVPHPHLLQRSFVWVPLLELNPDLALPDGRLMRQAVDPDVGDLSLWGSLFENAE